MERVGDTQEIHPILPVQDRKKITRINPKGVNLKF